MLLSVVVPVYNEEKTIKEILQKIIAVPLEKEIIVVDDSSRDGTRGILQGLLKSPEFFGTKVVYHSSNKGKGSSVRDGISLATGQYVVIQDGDLEYDPADYPKMLAPLNDGRAELVLGARFVNSRSGLLLHRLGNRALTATLNFLFRSRLNDYATCYKMARRSLFESLRLDSGGFEIDVELVCKALRKQVRIVEIPVAYHPRSYREGKKIRWVDGLRAFAAILKYRLAEA